MSKEMSGGTIPQAAHRRTQQLHGLQKRMAWAKQALGQPKKAQQMLADRGLSHEMHVDSAYYSKSRGDPMGTALSTEAGDDNWVSNLAPGDYWKDP